MTRVVVCDYGAGNTRSLCAALTRIGATPFLSNDPTTLVEASRVILPGVGSARSAMEHLTRTRAADALRVRLEAGQSTLGICLGMQLALDFSEEDNGVTTLGLLEGSVRRLDTERVPRIGWSTVTPWNETFYFAHSYGCHSPHTVASSDGVSAAITHGSFTGVQFHPEKSGPSGSAWLATWLSLG